MGHEDQLVYLLKQIACLLTVRAYLLASQETKPGPWQGLYDASRAWTTSSPNTAFELHVLKTWAASNLFVILSLIFGVSLFTLPKNIFIYFLKKTSFSSPI